MRKGNGKAFLILILLVAIVVLFFMSFVNFKKSPEEEATETVHKFYQFEQDGAFSHSWELFHPLMQKKFEKGYYIQDRAHVFMNHFGVQSYTYSLSGPTEVQDWSMESGAEVIERLYKFEIAKTYKGKYGNFTIVQDVYATELEDGWRVLWDYNK
ncbi:hypothetical protein [Piscibacillus salipiscarius]|uniref:DUF4829 domain-containing protein n=1 Tax=Piscibacillus salipiscarius TaxID=299480 RepID=A0ABW5Q5X1_9BACI